MSARRSARDTTGTSLPSGPRILASVPPEAAAQPRNIPKRTNRTVRASDEEWAMIEYLRRQLYIDGRCAKIADTSDIFRCVLRLATKLPIDALVDDLLRHEDEA